jgi:hypothetical protein
MPLSPLRDTLVLAARHRGYRLLTLGFFTCGFQLAFIATHLPGYLFPGGLAKPAAQGASAGAAIAAKYPYDRIWQGYTLQYYNNGETTPFYSQTMYAWDSDWSRVGLLSKQPNVNLWPDYADTKPDQNWTWWKWKTGDAPART